MESPPLSYRPASAVCLHITVHIEWRTAVRLYGVNAAACLTPCEHVGTISDSLYKKRDDDFSIDGKQNTRTRLK